MIKEFTDKTKFNSLVNHITQSWEWGEFRSQTPSIKKVLRLASVENDKVIRVFQILFSRVPYLPFTVAYLPRSPFPNKQELEEIKKYCQNEKAIFLKIEPNISRHSGESAVGVTTPESLNTTLRDAGQASMTMKQGDPILPQHTIYIDLAKSEEQLLKDMHEKTRYNIRLAQKKGVVVKEENSEEGLEKFIKILEATEKRQGFYSHSADYYRLLWKSLSLHRICHILNAYSPTDLSTETSVKVEASAKEGLPTTNSELRTPPIASIMLFHFKDFLYYPYGGSDPQFREFMAPQLLHWEAIKLGKKLGAKTYDLWGSYKHTKSESDPFWGIYRLKSGFGGKDIDFPDSIDIPLSPLYSIFTFINSLRWRLLHLKRK